MIKLTDEDQFNTNNSRGCQTERSNSSNPRSKKFTQRPQTPHIDILAIREMKKSEPDNIIKNFSSFMKQIIDTNNENFLTGEINMIEYMISKYTNIDISEVKTLEKLSIKINSDFGLLNQFGQYMPNLKEL